MTYLNRKWEKDLLFSTSVCVFLSIMVPNKMSVLSILPVSLSYMIRFWVWCKYMISLLHIAVSLLLKLSVARKQQQQQPQEKYSDIFENIDKKRAHESILVHFILQTFQIIWYIWLKTNSAHDNLYTMIEGFTTFAWTFTFFSRLVYFLESTDHETISISSVEKTYENAKIQDEQNKQEETIITE